MRKTGKSRPFSRRLCLVALALLSFSFTQGCSSNPVRENRQEEPTPSQLPVTQTAEPAPIPVEVAADLTRLARQENRFHASGYGSGSPFNININCGTDGKVSVDSPGPGQNRVASSPATPARSRAKASRAPAGQSRKPGAHIAYKVKEGDTLMKVAFETFGDLRRWREIYELNKDKIRNPSALVKGTVLKIYLSNYVVVEKNGKPYLIVRNDTLGKISNKLYGTPKQWKKLWHNNRQLIHDPNKIYAGFYLYYVNGKQEPGQPVPLASTNPSENPPAPASSTGASSDQAPRSPASSSP